MNFFTTIQMCNLILVASYVASLDALKCWKSPDIPSGSNLKAEVGKGAAIPTSGDCATADKYCKISKSDDGTTFSCTTGTSDGIEIATDATQTNPKCNPDKTVCYCNQDDCNSKDDAGKMLAQIDCYVGGATTKKKCQHGIVNCMNNTKTGTDTTKTYSCGNTKTGQTLECSGTATETDGQTCYYTIKEEETKNSSPRQFSLSYFVPALSGIILITKQTF